MELAYHADWARHFRRYASAEAGTPPVAHDKMPASQDQRSSLLTNNSDYLSETTTTLSAFL